MSEFAIIDALRERLGGIAGGRLVLGIGDDAALWRPTPDHTVVACCDTLIEGRHFPADAAPDDLGWKALAVNLSDLAAMGATPVAALLALTLPHGPDTHWLDAFCRGWAELARRHEVALAGGDTTRGPMLAVTVTCFGELPDGTALRRDGARVGDGVYVSGTLGDAAAGLAEWSRRGEPAIAPLAVRLNRPAPRLALGRALRGIASAAIDVSDGLAADLGHVLAASGVGADVDVARLPLSPALRAATDPQRAVGYALAGGDDYELCFTVPSVRESELAAIAAAADTPVARIGTIVSAPGARWLDRDGRELMLAVEGWDHFA